MRQCVARWKPFASTGAKGIPATAVPGQPRYTGFQEKRGAGFAGEVVYSKNTDAYTGRSSWNEVARRRTGARPERVSIRCLAEGSARVHVRTSRRDRADDQTLGGSHARMGEPVETGSGCDTPVFSCPADLSDLRGRVVPAVCFGPKIGRERYFRGIATLVSSPPSSFLTGLGAARFTYLTYNFWWLSFQAASDVRMTVAVTLEDQVGNPWKQIHRRIPAG